MPDQGKPLWGEEMEFGKKPGFTGGKTQNSRSRVPCVLGKNSSWGGAGGVVYCEKGREDPGKKKKSRVGDLKMEKSSEQKIPL